MVGRTLEGNLVSKCFLTFHYSQPGGMTDSNIEGRKCPDHDQVSVAEIEIRERVCGAGVPSVNWLDTITVNNKHWRLG